jgi:hypothetical protein
MKIPNAKILAGLAAHIAAGITAQVINLRYAERQFMNLINFTLPSFKRKQIVTTEGNKGLPAAAGNEDQPFVNFVIFCSKSLFLLGTVLLFGLATSVQAQFTYTTDNGTITITGYNGPGGAVTIPNMIDDLPVTDIATNAFELSALASVTIPDSVTNIGDYAFYNCLELTNVTFGDSVTSIGAWAFSGTHYEPGPAMAIVIVTGCPLTSITIPNSVTSIGANAFYACWPLTNVTIGVGLATIGDNAFADCSSLTAFKVASGNPAYSSVAGVLFNQSQTTLLEYPCGLGGSYAIPASVTTIESNAFYNSDVANVTIPDSVLSIGDYAFYDCGLTNVSLGDSLTNIGACAFSGSEQEPELLPGLYGPVVIVRGCPLTRITIPSSVTSIGGSAFSGCQSLTNIDFLGNAPDADSTVFSEDPLSAYYLPGTTGWAEFTTNTGVPTALWTLPYPLILNGSSGAQANQFGFTISWATNVPVVVEASTDLFTRVWTPIATNTLTGGTSYFSDPDWTNYPNRFYRLRSQ